MKSMRSLMTAFLATMLLTSTTAFAREVRGENDFHMHLAFLLSVASNGNANAHPNLYDLRFAETTDQEAGELMERACSFISSAYGGLWDVNVLINGPAGKKWLAADKRKRAQPTLNLCMKMSRDLKAYCQLADRKNGETMKELNSRQLDLISNLGEVLTGEPQ